MASFLVYQKQLVTHMNCFCYVFKMVFSRVVSLLGNCCCSLKGKIAIIFIITLMYQSEVYYRMWLYQNIVTVMVTSSWNLNWQDWLFQVFLKTGKIPTFAPYFYIDEPEDDRYIWTRALRHLMLFYCYKNSSDNLSHKSMFTY